MLGQLEPGETMVFRMYVQEDRDRLLRWLQWADTILGMNLPFDIMMLRGEPDFRYILDGRHFLIDLGVINYLHCEVRIEKSLKDIGPILGQYRYDETKLLREGFRYDGPDDPDLLNYNGQDTHNTVLGLSELGRRLARDFPASPKLAPFVLQYYNDALWADAIRMGETGVAMSRSKLETMERELKAEIETAAALAESGFGLILGGKGSQLSKDAFLDNLLTEFPHLRQHHLFQFTEKLGKPKFSDENRTLVSGNLPPGHPGREALRLATVHAKASKLLNSYVMPLLYHRKQKKKGEIDRRDVLVSSPTQPEGVGIVYPTWYITPGFEKDASGDEGGQVQARPSAKFPAVQTFPAKIKEALTSRWEGGVVLVADLSQVELRVAALLSGDPYLVAAYVNGEDLHAGRAVQIFGPSIREKPDFAKKWRQGAKHVNFTDLNLGGWLIIQKTLLKKVELYIGTDICKEIVRQRPIQRPGLTAWQEKLIHDTFAAGIQILPFTGISRYFIQPRKRGWGDEGGEADLLKSTIVNFPIQATAATTMMRIQAWLHRHLPSLNAARPNIVMESNVYDAVYFDCRTPADAEIAKELFRQAVEYVAAHDYWAWMQELHGRTIPLGFDAHTL